MPPAIAVRKRWALGCALWVVTGLCVFALPFALPPRALAGVSSANEAGFNNTVAAFAAVLLSVVSLLLFYRSSRPRPHAETPPASLSRKVLVFTTSLICGVTGLVCWLVQKSHVLYGSDVGYFVNRISMHRDFGLHLYSQIEFPYGPLLFYVPEVQSYLLGHFGYSLRASYFLSMLVQEGVGLLLLGYVLSSLPGPSRWKTLFFVLLSTQALQPLLGLNYTYFRFIVPAAALVFLSRHTRSVGQAVILSFFGQFVCLGISAEMGISFLAGSTALLLYRARAKKGVVLGVAGSFAAFTCFFALVGRDYLRMLLLFANGLYNLVVQPLPHTVIYLTALVLLAPLAVASCVRSRSAHAPLLVGLYVSALPLVKVAFGRADPTHVVFNGLAVLLLSFVALDYLPSLGRGLWLACIAVLIVDQSLTVNHLLPLTFHQIHENLRQDAAFRRDIGAAAHVLHLNGLERSMRRQVPPAPASLDVAALESFVGHSKVATPFEMDLPSIEELQRTGHLRPSFFFFQIAVLSKAAEEQSVREFNSAKWALLPPLAGSLPMQSEDPRNEWQQGLHWTYPLRRPIYESGHLFARNLQQNWVRFATVGPYVLYQRKGLKP